MVGEVAGMTPWYEKRGFNDALVPLLHVQGLEPQCSRLQQLPTPQRKSTPLDPGSQNQSSEP